MASVNAESKKADKPRAGDGNRTRTTSLEGWSSTIELRPQRPPERLNARPTPVAYRLPPRRRATSRATQPRNPAHGTIAIRPSTAPGTLITLNAVFVAVTIGVTAPLSSVLPGDRT